MIAFDTNALVRMLVEDDPLQGRLVKDIVLQTERQSSQILILTEVLIETVWVLESVYHCTRNEVFSFLELLIHTPVFALSDPSVVRNAVFQYREGGDFADMIIVAQAKQYHAKKIISFDKKLQKKYPDFVVESLF